MPRNFALACHMPRCPHRRPCPVHRVIAAPRASAAARGYGRAWEKARAAFLVRHPDCVDCGAPATDVDHRVAHRGDMAIFWDSSLWEPRCHSCHSRATVRFDRGFGRAPRAR